MTFTATLNGSGWTVEVHAPAGTVTAHDVECSEAELPAVAEELSERFLTD